MKILELQRQKTPKERLTESLQDLLSGLSKFPELVSTYQGTFMEEGETFKVALRSYRMQIIFEVPEEEVYDPAKFLLKAWQQAKREPLFSWFDQHEVAEWEKFIGTLSQNQSTLEL